jgi:hypothetical protein
MLLDPQQLDRVLRQLRYDFDSLSLRSARMGHTHLEQKQQQESLVCESHVRQARATGNAHKSCWMG